jgi:RimJ/RimL family protein N-acetyltransferase
MHFAPCTLTGAVVRLEPLTLEHLPELTRVALSVSEIFTHFALPMRSAAEIEQTFVHGLAKQTASEIVAFTTRLVASGELIGGTLLRLVDRTVPSVEIGGTWIVPRWQRTCVNTEAKLLQLSHCFEQLGCQRVELKTDVRNERSQAAIARIGATREGVLRSHMRRVDGSLRDSVLFSMLASEWPDRRERLRARLAPQGSAAAQTAA